MDPTIQLQKAQKHKISRAEFNELVEQIKKEQRKKLLGENTYVERFYQIYQDALDGAPDIIWALAELDLAKLQARYKENPAYERTKFNNLTFSVLWHFIERIRTNKNIIACYKAGQRRGKSYQALCDLAYIDSTVTPDRICFSLDDSPAGEGFFSKIGASNPGDAFLIDEKMNTWGTGQKRIKGEGDNIIAAVGKRKNSVLSCSPEINPMGYNEYNFEPELISEIPFGWCQSAVLDDVYQPLGRRYSVHPSMILGQSFVDTYEAMKDKFLQSLIKTDYYSLYDIRAAKVFFDPRFDGCNSSKEGLLWLVNQVHKNLRDNTEASKLATHIRQTLKHAPTRFEEVRKEQLKQKGIIEPEPEYNPKPILFETTTEEAEKKESEKFDFRSEEQIMADKVIESQNKNKSKQEIFHEERQKRKIIMEKLKKEREEENG